MSRRIERDAVPESFELRDQARARGVHRQVGDMSRQWKRRAMLWPRCQSRKTLAKLAFRATIPGHEPTPLHVRARCLGGSSRRAPFTQNNRGRGD